MSGLIPSRNESSGGKQNLENRKDNENAVTEEEFKAGLQSEPLKRQAIPVRVCRLQSTARGRPTLAQRTKSRQQRYRSKLPDRRAKFLERANRSRHGAAGQICTNTAKWPTIALKCVLVSHQKDYWESLLPH